MILRAEFADVVVGSKRGRLKEELLEKNVAIIGHLKMQGGQKEQSGRATLVALRDCGVSHPQLWGPSSCDHMGEAANCTSARALLAAVVRQPSQ